MQCVHEGILVGSKPCIFISNIHQRSLLPTNISYIRIEVMAWISHYIHVNSGAYLRIVSFSLMHSCIIVVLYATPCCIEPYYKETPMQVDKFYNRMRLQKMSFVVFQTMYMVCCVMYLSTNCWRLVPQAQALTTYLLLASNRRNLWAKTWCLCVPLCRSSIEITRVEHNWCKEGAGCDGILCEKLAVQYFNKKLSSAPPELRIKHPIKMYDIHTYNRYPSASFGILEFIRCSTFIAVVNIVNIIF